MIGSWPVWLLRIAPTLVISSLIRARETMATIAARCGSCQKPAFLNERVGRADGAPTVAGMTMLGVVEATARIAEGRMTGLEITGDVIAPAMTLSALSDACEGLVAAAPALQHPHIRLCTKK